MVVRLAVLMGAVLLSACGFEPLYDPASPGGGVDLSRVAVADIPERLGQQMRNRLVQNLTGSSADYELRIALRQESLGFGLRGDDQITGAPGDAAATQEQLSLYADYQLVDLDTGTIVIDETLWAESSFDLVLSDFAIVAQREDTAERLAFQLADRLEQRIAVYLRQQGTPATP